jgi:hypothetical protein
VLAEKTSGRNLWIAFSAYRTTDMSEEVQEHHKNDTCVKQMQNIVCRTKEQYLLLRKGI